MHAWPQSFDRMDHRTPPAWPQSFDRIDHRTPPNAGTGGRGREGGRDGLGERERERGRLVASSVRMFYRHIATIDSTWF